MRSLSFYTPSFLHEFDPDGRVVITSSIAFASLLVVLYRDFRAYKRLSPGGLPHNAIGWILTNYLAFRYQNPPLELSYYQECIDEGDDDRSWLDAKEWEMRKRDGIRPTVARHPVPNRQINQIPRDEVAKVRAFRHASAIVSEMEAILARNPNLLSPQTSVFEKRGHAIFLAPSHQPSTNPFVRNMVENSLHRELAHVHYHGEPDGSYQIDYSLHMTLAPRDCELAVQSGFAQRGLVSGKPYNRLPSNYMFVYAPRTLEEVRLVMQLVRASIGYLAGLSREEAQVL